LVGVLLQVKFEFLAELGFLPAPLQPPSQFPNEPVHVGSYFNLYSFRALSRRTMRASSTARSRVMVLSRSISVSARPSASRPVAAAMNPASSHPSSFDWG